MKIARLSLIAAGLLGLASVAHAGYALAQNAPAPFAGQPGRPAPVAVTSDGHVARLIVGPMGHMRGFVLDNGTAVMVHGREGDAVASLAIGAPVHVEGFGFPGATAMIHHATVTAPGGQVLIAPQPHGQHGNWGANGANGTPPADRMAGREARHQEMAARFAQLPVVSTSATVQTVLAGPRGGVHMVLLSNGTSVFLPRPIAEAVRARGGIRAGENLQVSGHGGAYPQGTSIMADHVTFADGSTAVAQ